MHKYERTFFWSKGERKLCFGLEKLMFVIFDFETKSKDQGKEGVGVLYFNPRNQVEIVVVIHELVRGGEI